MKASRERAEAGTAFRLSGARLIFVNEREQVNILLTRSTI
jgi:hypothetical protein